MLLNHWIPIKMGKTYFSPTCCIKEERYLCNIDLKEDCGNRKKLLKKTQLYIPWKQ